MPSWANHFKVADKLYNQIHNLDLDYFLIGNIAPGCGIPTGKNGAYLPPSSITHFTKADISYKDDCDYEYLYNNYIKNERDIKKLSFFIGYFVHLVTDCEFTKNVYYPIKSACSPCDASEFWKIMKLEIHNMDCAYLLNNESRSFEKFKELDCFSEEYPKWYKPNQITKQMKNIVKYYSGINSSIMDYKYVNLKIMDDYIEETVNKVIIELNKRNISL